MPPIAITEKNLQFSFPEGWRTTKFDEWSFYRRQFMPLGEARILCGQPGCSGEAHCVTCGSKRIASTRGIDILAIDLEKSSWHIEIKDYRLTRRTNFVSLADEVALKVRDTLACLVAARLNANDPNQKSMAEAALACNRIRIVLHLEPPPIRGSLASPISQRANVLQRLKQLVKSIDPDPLVVSIAGMNNLAWSVAEVRSS